MRRARGEGVDGPHDISDLNLKVVSAIVFVLFSALVAGAQSKTKWYQFDPLILKEGVSSAVLEAKIEGGPSRVVLEQSADGAQIELRDDGSGGDKTPGDGVYTGAVNANLIVQSVVASDVHRPFVGYLVVYDGTTVAQRVNVFAEVINDEIPRLAVTNLAQDVQQTAYLVNIHDPQYFADLDNRRVIRRFYQFFEDDFDDVAFVVTPSHIANRNYQGVKNEVVGTGVGIFNNTADYGSGGRLLGVINFPITGYFDGAEVGYSHELGHQWINFLSMDPLSSGIPHWPVSSLASGIMGMSIPGSGAGGNFPCNLVRESGGVRLNRQTETQEFTDLDLYLAGFLRPDQVGEHLVFADQNAAFNLTCNGGLYTGPMRTVTINDVIGYAGPRVPDSSTSQKRFHIATIIVSKDGLLDADAMSFYSYFAKRAEATSTVPVHEGLAKYTGKPFAVATRGLGSIVSALSATAVPQEFTISATPLEVTITAGQSSTQTITVTGTGGFSDSVTLQCTGLPALSTCSFSPTSVSPGANGGTSTLTIQTTAARASTLRKYGAQLLWLVLLGVVLTGGRRARGWSTVVLLLALASCGGGSSSTTSPNGPGTPGTPAGTYSVSVTGTAGAMQRVAVVTVNVR